MEAPRLTPPNPALTDGTITLRLWDPADIEQVTEACQDPDIQRFLPVPRPYRRIDALAYVERTHRQWWEGSKAAFAIVPADRPAEVLGAINLAVAGSTGNAAYWVAPGARGRSVAASALGLLTRWAFEVVGLAVIILEIDPTNMASQGVARAAGYHEAGHLDVNTATGERDHLIWSRLAFDDELRRSGALTR
jgi:RimJ/RimL family protein N-acetyltransferase